MSVGGIINKRGSVSEKTAVSPFSLAKNSQETRVTKIHI